MKSDMARLTGNINMLDTEIKSLNNNLTKQMKSFEPVSAKINVLYFIVSFGLGVSFARACGGPL
jgi:hypothetical protein